VIKPTIGRVVWYYPPGVAGNGDTQPCSAQIAFIHTDNNVNLGYFDPNGVAKNATSVYLHPGDDIAPRPTSNFAEWMPYQKGQAAKTEALEAAGGKVA
jgi:hypothetical protein